jgi:hypothetical protein
MTVEHHPRQRCTECRGWFRPAPTATTTQRVCSPACRASRDRKLALIRRDHDLPASRDDERQRQRACRARRKAATAAASPGVTGPPVTPRHAPPSAHDPLRLQQILLDSWDKEAARSRATLARLLAGFTGVSGASGETRPTPAGPMSRATLPTETASFLDGS